MKETENIEGRIIAAARQVFLEKGFNEASMSDIAAMAGINRTGLHYYFRTKDRMFEAVFSDIVSSFLPGIQEIITQDKPVAERIGKIVDIYFDTMRRNPKLAAFVVKEIQRDSRHLTETIKKADSGHFAETLMVCLEKEKAAGTIRNIPTPFLLYTYYGLIFAPIISGPLTDIVFPATEEEHESMMQEWKSIIVNQLCSLLSVRP